MFRVKDPENNSRERVHPRRRPEVGAGNLGGREAQGGGLGSSHLLLWHRDVHTPSVWVRTDRRLPGLSGVPAVTL